MDRILTVVEKSVLYVLMALMAIVLILATIDLIYTLVAAILTPPVFVVALDKLLEVFGIFLLVLVGLEVLATLRAYFKEHVVHAEIVLLAAMIAVSREAIILDVAHLDPIIPFAIAVLILALATAYFLVKRAQTAKAPETQG
jgi:uncharacterized membrane protein (DUF373 family)